MSESNATADRYPEVISVSLENALTELAAATSDLVSLPKAARGERRAREVLVCQRARAAYKMFLELVIFRGKLNEQERAALVTALRRAAQAIQSEPRFQKSVQDKLEEIADPLKVSRYTERVTF